MRRRKKEKEHGKVKGKRKKAKEKVSKETAGHVAKRDTHGRIVLTRAAESPRVDKKAATTKKDKKDSKKEASGKEARLGLTAWKARMTNGMIKVIIGATNGKNLNNKTYLP